MSYVAAGTAAAVVVGGLIQSDSASSASNKQNAATDKAIAAGDRQFTLTRADQEPYRAAGSASLNLLQKMLGIGVPSQGAPTGPTAVLRGNLAFKSDTGEYLGRFGHGDKGGETLNDIAPTWGVSGVIDENGNTAWTQPGAQTTAPQASPADSPLLKGFSVDDFWKDPVVQLGYQSGLDLGTKALKNAAPLTTGLDSGAAMKELTKFGTDYAGNMAAGSQSRFEGNKTNVFNRLMGLITGGQTANAVDANAGAVNAGTNAGLISAQGNAAAAARIAQGNAQAGGISSIANWWNQQNTLDRLYPRSTPTSSFSYTGGTASNPAYG
jgi:hypothetical protein